MISRERNTYNGKPIGAWYHFPDGRTMYLAHYSGEKTPGLLRNINAWCIDTSTLREAERRGCEAVGVLHRVGNARYFYLTNRRDFWESDFAGRTTIKSREMRTLPRSRFLVNPALDERLIETNMRLR